MQRPHPPIYIAATRTPETLEFAVNNGFPTMIGLTVDNAPAIELCHRYEAMSAEAGHNVTTADIPFFRYTYLAETEEQAREEAYKSLNWVIDLLQWRGTLNGASEASGSIEEWRKTRGAPSLTFDHVAEHRSISARPSNASPKSRHCNRKAYNTSAATSPSAACPARRCMRRCGCSRRR